MLTSLKSEDTGKTIPCDSKSKSPLPKQSVAQSDIGYAGGDPTPNAEPLSDPSASSDTLLNGKELGTEIRYNRMMLEHTPPGHPTHPDILSYLEIHILDRFRQAGDRADLEATIKYFEEALELLPLGHHTHSSSLNNLTLIITTRFDQTGDRSDPE
ncbi:hypothetical protein FRB98_009068 [Tulasnella sp. 332]|nr:hypothetical protein FRB98_009068 [Tulasnella sp. 332]